MTREIAARLNSLKEMVKSGSFVNDIQNVKDWRGADVIISKELTCNLREWLGDQPEVISTQSTAPRRRVVITEFPKELSWVFNQLGDIFADEIDHISKYDFYGMLAQSANDYLNENKADRDCKGLLFSVIDRANNSYSG